ncbi:phytanoyl-CoA dioxygenase family protein [Aldersonia sp. NBC_00410]|uniref:phytanoyl-CoA dioxygenase family protein n=1 Tax=Aldersonia sp. NBC_00410 TaxID=2975954 RepID=UPI00225AFFC7|nr:phytanoyl-CoA dioxygenase family protein [Aldersonia sp. NBC_00410]MCX5042963.1 phytanoyl-CoA dioxygenase family protein [Aldersonia sp. NBC_00410]
MIDIDAFIADGFIKVAQAVPRAVADGARDLLWHQIGLSPDAPESWTAPVVWTQDLSGTGPFAQLCSSPLLAAALDAVCGTAGWVARSALGTIPVRFPVPATVDDRGWHIDQNTTLSDGSWAVSGRPHTVLVLTLLAEVGPHDAPTRIRVGSHRDVARVLTADPVDIFEFAPRLAAASSDRPVALATGQPGDMYVLHPFTVHAADEHRGTVPRFMAQTPFFLREPLGPETPSALAQVWRQAGA